MKKLIHSVHDRFFRQAMSDPRVAKAFFEHHLPPVIRQAVDLNTLQLQKDSYVDEQLQLSLTDILFSVALLAGQVGYFYVLVEHQSTPDKLMPFRLLKYLIAIMEQHLKQHPKAGLPIIYPLVFYTGQKAYPHSTDILDLFDDPLGLAPQIYFKPFQLVQVNQIPDEALKQQVWSGLMELCMKHIFARDVLPFLQGMVSFLQQIESADGSSYVQAALTYLLTAGDVSNSDAFLETIQHHLTPETGDTIMTIAQQLKAEGESIGIAKGKAEGRAEGRAEGESIGITKGQTEAKKAIARRLLEKGLSVETVSQVTELSMTEVQAVYEQIQVH